MTRLALLPFERRFRDWIEENGMSWATTTLPVGSNDETTGYRLSPAGPPRRTVLALHGAGNDALFGWVGLFKRQLRLGSEVVTFDLPGHGRGTSTRFSTRSARNSIMAAVDACSRRSPALPLHAIGLSLGGSILLAALPDLRDRLTSATLVVAPLRIHLSPGAVLSELRPSTVGLLWREREHYGLSGLVPSFGPFKRDIYPLRLADAAPSGAFGYVSALNEALASLDLEAAARSVRTPVLLAYGGRDRVVSAGQGERLARLIPGSEILRVEGGTHLSTPMDPGLIDRIEQWMARWET